MLAPRGWFIPFIGENDHVFLGAGYTGLAVGSTAHREIYRGQRSLVNGSYSQDRFKPRSRLSRSFCCSGERTHVRVSGGCSGVG